MKVNFDKFNKQNMIFEGYKPVKNTHGDKGFEFSYPYDEQNYECYLELVRLTTDKDGNYITTEGIKNIDEETYSLQMKPGSNYIDLDYDYGLEADKPFAYHYRLKNKHTQKETWAVDVGDVIDNTSKGAHEIYNVVVPTGADPARGGSMKLVIPDSYKVGFLYDKDGKIVFNKDIQNKAMKSVRTFANKMGGTLAGIEKDVEDGKFDGYSRIISTPIFTDDSLTHHAYWNKNSMQMVQSLGSIENYTSLQRKMFGKGLNWVSDGAFVNEGLEGVHFSHILKWGEDSPYFNWFRAEGLKNGPLRLGVLPDDLSNVGYKIVRPVSKYSNPKEYTPPIYLQIFDKRLVSDENMKDSSKLILKYDKLNTDNLLEINSHQDVVIPYHFEISPKEYEANIKKIDPNSPNAVTQIAKFTNFELGRKIEGGFDPWDANTDIPKLNYVTSHFNTRNAINNDGDVQEEVYKNLTQNNIMVQDYAVSSGKYWTKKTNQILNLHAAQNLKDINDPQKAYKLILENTKKGIFPKRLEENISQKIIENVFEKGEYDLKGIRNKAEYKNQIIGGLMNVPLDTIELGDNIVSVLSSPYISKRATKEDEIGVSRYDLYNETFDIQQNIPEKFVHTYNSMNKVYSEEMYNFANEILGNINKNLPKESKLYDGLNATDYGKYVIPLLTAEIAKFAVIKSLVPKAEVKINPTIGGVTYDYDELKMTSLQSIGIGNISSPEDEAVKLIGKMRDGLRLFKDKDGHNYKQISNDKKLLVEGLSDLIKGTNLYSFELAEVVVDRSGSGLDWRIDATKDISDIDSLRNKKTTFDASWKQVINFWKKFNDGVLSENPNAYIVSEMIDEFDMGDMNKFIRQTGMASTANYRYFFTDIPKLFGKIPEHGANYQDVEKFPTFIFEKMIGSNYIHYAPLKSLIHSYTFASNHDKPRILHGLALDLELLHCTDLNKANDYYKERAYRLCNDSYFGNVPFEKFDFSNISSKDIAMADSLEHAFTNTLNSFAQKGTFSAKKKQYTLDAVNQSIKDLANGRFDNMIFDEDAFGVKPFDVTISIVLDQAEKQHGLKLKPEERKILSDAVFKSIMDPAMSKLTAMMKFFVALPGMPTLFSGDELGSSGFETKSKNIYLQNRGVNHLEWVNEKSPYYKEFVANYKNEIEKTMALRSRPELHALNDGAIFVLKKQKTHNGMEASAILRQSTDGAMAISVFNTIGVENHDYKHKYEPSKITLEKIELNGIEKTNIGLQGGLKEGLKFVNANNPNEIYYTRYSDNGGYSIKKHETGIDVPIPVTDSTLILYYVPDKTKTAPPAFLGSKVMYNPQYNFVSKPYTQSEKAVTGSKISVLSK